MSAKLNRSKENTPVRTNINLFPKDKAIASKLGEGLGVSEGIRRALQLAAKDL